MMDDVSEKEWHTGPPAVRPPGDPAQQAPHEPLPAPRSPLPEPIDPEAVRQFQQFQQFQELMRQQGDAPLLAPARKPLWRKALGSKTVRRLVLLLIVVLGLYLAYQHYFGTKDGLPASETGGQRMSGTTAVPSTPRETVRMVYQQIAYGNPVVGCGMFDERTDAAHQFAVDMGYSNCAEAINGLHARMTGTKNEYAEPEFPEALHTPPTSDVVEIRSCDLQVVGGPRLGAFTVSKLPPSRAKTEQWVITAHRKETC